MSARFADVIVGRNVTPPIVHTIMTKHKAIVVNLFGGPSSGKSTSAAGAFAKLKIMGVNCELVSEYAKSLVWSGRKTDNQVLILGKQYDRLWQIRDQVDLIISDSPLLLTPLYNSMNPLHIPSLDQVAIDLYNQFKNVNILINRVKPYSPHGRNQNEEQARSIDVLTRSMLDRMGIPYHEVDGNQDGIDQIVKIAILEMTI